MHTLNLALSNPVFEATNDHGRLVHHVSFNGELLEGSITTTNAIKQFDVTIHPTPTDAISPMLGISVESANSTEASVDVVLDPVIIQRLLHVGVDDQVTLFLRFEKGGVRGRSGEDVFEQAGHPGAIEWYATRAQRVEHVFCGLKIQPGARGKAS